MPTSARCPARAVQHLWTTGSLPWASAVNSARSSQPAPGTYLVWTQAFSLVVTVSRRKICCLLKVPEARWEQLRVAEARLGRLGLSPQSSGSESHKSSAEICHRVQPKPPYCKPQALNAPTRNSCPRSRGRTIGRVAGPHWASKGAGARCGKKNARCSIPCTRGSIGTLPCRKICRLKAEARLEQLPLAFDGEASAAKRHNAKPPQNFP